MSIRSKGIIMNKILFGIQTVSINQMPFEMFSAKCQPFCSGFEVLELILLLTVRWELVWGHSSHLLYLTRLTIYSLPFLDYANSVAICIYNSIHLSYDKENIFLRWNLKKKQCLFFNVFSRILSDIIQLTPYCHGTRLLPEPVLANHQWSLAAFTWGQFCRKYPRHLSCIWVWQLLI